MNPKVSVMQAVVVDLVFVIVLVLTAFGSRIESFLFRTTGLIYSLLGEPLYSIVLWMFTVTLAVIAAVVTSLSLRTKPSKQKLHFSK